MVVLVVGLGFGVWQVKQNQNVKNSKASYCAGCGTIGQCECSGNVPTGNMCLYAPDECKSLGLTWQPNSTCNSYFCGGGQKAGPTPTPTSNERGMPTPTPVGVGVKKEKNPTPTPYKRR